MYLDTDNKTECFGCEACAQICPKNAIEMKADVEGFRYPAINMEYCINCGLCRKVCPQSDTLIKHDDNKYVFGGYHIDKEIRFESTSGGAFSAIVDVFCDENYVIFGAEASGVEVTHHYIQNKDELNKFRKSKYAQSNINGAYDLTKKFLLSGEKVLFSGTPCQIAALKMFLKNIDQTNLLTVEVICEGIPSPHYILKYEEYLNKKFGAGIKTLDYRYTGNGILSRWKWDFQIMKIKLTNGRKKIIKDRWVNPFWSVWLDHLMSRPSCYKCPFAEPGRIADITLGDLWGVHLYCPELYGKNGGSSLVVGNTSKGIDTVKKAQKRMHGHELQFEQALAYQSPMRKHIGSNPNRAEFMADLASGMSYVSINKKWSKRPTFKLLCQKYIWGNRQKILVWKIWNFIKKG